jgi:hypothetical protein
VKNFFKIKIETRLTPEQFAEYVVLMSDADAIKASTPEAYAKETVTLGVRKLTMVAESAIIQFGISKPVDMVREAGLQPYAEALAAKLRAMS